MTIVQISNSSLEKASEKDILFRESFVFVLDLIQYTELLEQKRKRSLAKQLLKAGTCFGKIVNEARFTEERKSYFYKIKKIKKNAQSIKYLLQLCKYSNTYPDPNNLILDLGKLINKISDILKTQIFIRKNTDFYGLTSV